MLSESLDSQVSGNNWSRPLAPMVYQEFQQVAVDAERWEHLAEAEISALFEQCNTTKPEVRKIRPAA